MNDTQPESQPEANRLRVTRRQTLQGAGVAAGVVASIAGGAAAGAAVGDAAQERTLPTGFTGTMADLKHVVILMQENRSFDHYFGPMPGVRGFNDKQALRFQDGTTVFQQKDASGNITTPTANNGTWGNGHGFTTNNGRRWDYWVREKGTSTMGYHTPAMMSFYWSVASQFTIGDQHFCSILGPTDCNRKYLMSGMSNGEVNNSDESNYSRYWTTVPEQLQEAGIDWRQFTSNIGTSAGRQTYRSDWFGDYGDNELKYFRGFEPNGLAADDPKLAPGTGLIWRANAQYYKAAPTGVPNTDSAANLDYVLADFAAACQPDAEFPLPEVSWIVAPYGWCEHPSADTDHGERFVERILDILQSNEEIWNHTLFILNYDENDGKFDHVLPPFAEPGTPGEYVSGGDAIRTVSNPTATNLVASGGSPIGLGPRVPLLMVSPWTRGGWVTSEVFDQTSTILFLEKWAAFLGKPFTCPNISAWRRSVVGDLTSAIDFANPQFGPTDFADPLANIAVNIPDDHMKPRPLSFHGDAALDVDRATGRVTATMTLTGGPEGKALGFQVFPDRHKAFSNTPFTVAAGQPKQYVWDATATDGKYAFTIYSNDGFVRSFAGQVVPAGVSDTGIPRVDAELVGGSNAKVRLTLRNDGTEPVRYQLVANDHLGGTQTVHVNGGDAQTVTWPTKQGYYDVVVTADTGTGWTQRYAGRVATA